MPYGSNPWLDVAGGAGGINQSMAGIALAQRQAQYRMQQQAAQNALEQQYVNIAKERETREGKQTDSTINYQGAEAKRAGAETEKYGLENDMARQTMATQGRIGRLRGYEGSPDIMSMIQDPATGPRMMGDLRDADVVPQGQFQLSPQQILQAIHSALGGQVYQQGAGTAASAERMTEPVQMGQNQTAFDPFSRQPMMQTGPAPMSPYQREHLSIEQGKADETGRHNLNTEASGLLRARGSVAGDLGKAFLPQNDPLRQAAEQALGQSLGISQQGGGKQLDHETAAKFLQQAGGDKEKAREMAKQAGYTF